MNTPCCHICRKEVTLVKYKSKLEETDEKSGTGAYLNDSQCNLTSIFVHYKCAIDHFDEKGNNFGSCQQCNSPIRLSVRVHILECKLHTLLELNILFWLVYIVGLILHASIFDILLMYWPDKIIRLIYPRLRRSRPYEIAYFAIYLSLMIMLLLLEIDTSHMPSVILVAQYLIYNTLYYVYLTGTSENLKSAFRLSSTNLERLIAIPDNTPSPESAPIFVSPINQTMTFA